MIHCLHRKEQPVISREAFPRAGRKGRRRIVRERMFGGWDDRLKSRFFLRWEACEKILIGSWLSLEMLVNVKLISFSFDVFVFFFRAGIKSSFIFKVSRLLPLLPLLVILYDVLKSHRREICRIVDWSYDWSRCLHDYPSCLLLAESSSSILRASTQLRRSALRSWILAATSYSSSPARTGTRTKCR